MQDIAASSPEQDANPATTAVARSAGPRVSAFVTRVMLPLHLLGVVAIAHLATHWRWSALLEVWLGWFVIGCIGVEIGLHREFAHRSIGLESRPTRWLLAWLGCMGAQWSPMYWAALHRGVHHRHADGERDLHTPRKGVWHAYMGWMVRDSATVGLGGMKHMLRDPMHALLHRRYLTVFWGSMVVLLLVLPLASFFTLVVLPILLSVHQENVVNVCCHIRALGYRNHATNDDSVNIWPLGILFWGQGFHNNHHAHADRSGFGERWFEFDSCRCVIPVLRWVDRRLRA